MFLNPAAVESVNPIGAKTTTEAKKKSPVSKSYKSKSAVNNVHIYIIIIII